MASSQQNFRNKDGMTNCGAKRKNIRPQLAKLAWNGSPKDLDESCCSSSNYQDFAETSRRCNDDLAKENYVQSQVALRNCSGGDCTRGVGHNSVTDTNCYANDQVSNTNHENDVDLRKRLQTFPRHWKYESIISKYDLAKYGWVYAGSGDRVYCFHCKGVMEGWKRAHTALGEHKRLYPKCDFILGMLSNIFGPSNSPSCGASQVSESRSETSSNQTSMAVISAKDFGYSTSVVQRAVQKLKRQSKSVTSENLLDELFKTAGMPGGDESPELPSPRSARVKMTDSRKTNEVYALPKPGSYISASGLVQRDDSSRVPPADMNSKGTDLEIAPTSSAIARKDSKTSRELIETDSIDETDAKPAQVDKVKLYEMCRTSEQWKNRITCKVCLDAEVGELFLPCRHLICCNNCAGNVKRCPLCRSQIVATIKAYL